MVNIEEINNAFKQALRDKNQEELAVLRMLKSNLQNKEIALKKEMEPTEVVATIKSEIKKRKESIEAFVQGNRPELAEKEKSEIKILEKFLPAQMSDDEVKTKVQTVIDGLSDEEKANFGLVMKTVMAEMKGNADGAIVSKAVKELLG